MNRLLRSVLGPLILAVAAFCPAGAQQWVEVRSPNFSVVTDEGEKRGREIALRFEQFRAVFATLFSRAKLNTPVPLQIIGFRNSKEMRQFAPLFQGKPVQLAGYFQPGEDRSFIALDLSSAYEGWAAVFHEYAHTLLNANYPGTQVWFDEGFAEYYSTLKVFGRDVQIGGVSDERGQQLVSSPLMPIAELFSVRRDSKTYNEGDRRSLFYAQSWLMVHYLFDTNKVNDTAAYFQLVDEGVPVLEAIQRAFHMTPKKLEESVYAYAHTSSAKIYRLKLPAAVDHLQFTTVPLDQADAQAILADLHLHERDYHEQAVKEFQAVLRLKPNHAAANRGLGYAYLRDNDFEKAAECFRRAAAQDSKDPRVHYFVAMLMAREASLAGRAPEDLATMRKELEAAIALDPQYADAFNLLAYVDGLDKQEDQAIEHMKRAVELSPRNELYAANLAQYLMHEELWEEAEPVVRRLEHSENPEIAATARRELDMISTYRKEVAAAKGVGRPAEPAGETPGLQPRPVVEKAEKPAEPKGPSPVNTGPDTRPIKYLRGTLTTVDCSTAPAATLTVVSAGKTWTMQTSDSASLVLIGADRFSCAWKNRKVLVNYRARDANRGDLVSLEVQ